MHLFRFVAHTSFRAISSMKEFGDSWVQTCRSVLLVTPKVAATIPRHDAHQGLFRHRIRSRSWWDNPYVHIPPRRKYSSINRSTFSAFIKDATKRLARARGASHCTIRPNEVAEMQMFNLPARPGSDCKTQHPVKPFTIEVVSFWCRAIG